MSLNSVSQAIERFIIRTLRIALGLVVALVIFVFGVSKAYELLSQPFAASSPVDVIGGLCLGAISLWALQWPFSIAFGPGPETPPAVPTP